MFVWNRPFLFLFFFLLCILFLRVLKSSKSLYVKSGRESCHSCIIDSHDQYHTDLIVLNLLVIRPQIPTISSCDLLGWNDPVVRFSPRPVVLALRGLDWQWVGLASLVLLYILNILDKYSGFMIQIQYCIIKMQAST